MTEPKATAAFAAFREAVFNDFHLLKRLRPPLARDAYVAQVIAVGAAHGFVFDESFVHAAMRDGSDAWLMQGVEVLL